MGTLTNILIGAAALVAMLAIVASDIYWALRKRWLRRRGWMPLDVFLKANGLNGADVETVCKAGNLHIRMRMTPNNRFIDGETATLILDRVKALTQSQATATKDNVQKAGLAAAGALIGAMAVSLAKPENSNSGRNKNRPTKSNKYKEQEFRLVKLLLTSKGKAEVWMDWDGSYLLKNFRDLWDDLGEANLRHLLHHPGLYVSSATIRAVIRGEPLDSREGSKLMAALFLSSTVSVLEPLERQPNISANDSKQLHLSVPVTTSKKDAPSRPQTRAPRAIQKNLSVPVTASKRHAPSAPEGSSKRPPLKKRWLRENTKSITSGIADDHVRNDAKSEVRKGQDRAPLK